MLVERIDALRSALLAGRIAEADAIATDIAQAADGWPPPDPAALRRSVMLLQATLSGLRAGAERLARLRGHSTVYDAQGRRQMHAAQTLAPRRW